MYRNTTLQVMLLLLFTVIVFDLNLFDSNNYTNKYKYIEKYNDEGIFTYDLRIVHKSESKSILILGDSEILALGNYLLMNEPNANVTLLGSGSCPLIPNAYYAYSNDNCFKLSQAIEDELKENRYDIVLFMNNYYAYYTTDSLFFEKYKEFSDALNCLSFDKYFVEVMPPIKSEFRSGIGRPFKRGYCDFMPRIDLSEFVIDSVIPISNTSLKVRDLYRDDVHINVQGVEEVYANVLQLINE